MTVIDLEAAKREREPHSTGRARCLDCKHEWIAVAPTSDVWFECPSCSLVRGRFIYPTTSKENHWHCSCGSDLFKITKDEIYCPNCGRTQRDF